VDLKKIKAIVDLVKDSGIAELEVTEGEDKLKITASGHHHIAPTAHIAHTNHTHHSHHHIEHTPAATIQSTYAHVEAQAAEVVTGNKITSPMVGTFYRSSSPTSEPLVEVGQEIKVGQVLCIIEAMKLMNQIESDQAGVIKEVLVADGAPVEFGQPLFVIA
jgi:acetyl-CoA carboxylase biotin carboxyl carrier protein